MIALGLDAGTTTASVVALDLDTGESLAQATREHVADTTPVDLKARGYAELDLTRMSDVVVMLLRNVVQAIGDRANEVVCIGVTGQQHGVAFLGADQCPSRSAITWQDRRASESVLGRQESVLEAMIRQAGGPTAFDRMGCVPSTGYLGTTLYWLVLHDALPLTGTTVCHVPDAMATFLTGEPPRTDLTDGGSSGVMDVVAGDWAWDTIEALGIPRGLFPSVGNSGERLGGLSAEIAERVGLPVGLPVGIAMGDNQASFLGSVREPDDSVLINIGTGGQISAKVDTFARLPEIQTRAFPGGGFLLVGAGLYGGRTYALLRDLFRQVGAEMFSADPAAELYDRMTELGQAVAPGCDGLVCEPLFTGTRADPTLTGAYLGMTPENATPGHLVRALLEGMAEGFHALLERLSPLAGKRSQLVGAGNALQLNPLLRQIIADRFGMPLHMALQSEAGARGAAIVAAAAQGVIPSLEAGTALHRYAEPVEPSV